MSFFYGGQTTPRLFGFIPFDEQDASAHFIKHYRKYLLLDWISKTDEDFNDREQARKELSHCEKVMDRWKLHPNWREEDVLPVIEKMKKKSIQELIDDYSKGE